MAEVYGACRFCGQVRVGPCENMGQEYANEEATKDCRCPEACAYRAREAQKREAKVYIQELFVDVSEGWVSVDDERIIKLMEDAVDLVSENKVRSMALSIPGVGTAKVSINSKDGIVIDRKKNGKRICNGKQIKLGTVDAVPLRSARSRFIFCNK